MAIRAKNKCSFDPNRGKGANFLFVFCLKVGRFGAFFAIFSLNTIRLKNGKKQQKWTLRFWREAKKCNFGVFCVWTDKAPKSQKTPLFTGCYKILAFFWCFLGRSPVVIQKNAFLAP